MHNEINFIDASDEKIIDFKSAKKEIEFYKMKKENKQNLTKILLTSGNSSQYKLFDCMCKLSETSRKVANDPVLKEKYKRLLKSR